VDGLGSARRRGTAGRQLQALVAATPINLKRLLTRPEAADNTADGDGGARACRGALRVAIERCTRRLTWAGRQRDSRFSTAF
jgi:hypothetical protein